MKTFVAIFFPTVFFLNNAVGQIIINNSHMPVSGDTLRYTNAPLSPMIDYNSTGMGYTWDFSGLDGISQGVEIYKSTLQVNPVYLLFFGITSYGKLIDDNISLGSTSIQDVYDFYLNNSSGFRAVGRGVEYNSIPIPSNYSDQDEIYKFPLEFGDHDSSTFAVEFGLTPDLMLFMKGSRVNDVEGWGTIITPFGSFQCLKVRTIIYEKDSLVLNNSPLPAIQTKKFEIKWLSHQTRIPVLEVGGTILFGNFQIVDHIRFRDDFNPCLAGPPPASFYASQTWGTIADQFSLFDSTDCEILYTNWSIEPASFNFISGSQFSTNPIVQFDAPGWYSVSHVAGNTLGLDTLIRNNYIYISGVGVHEELQLPVSVYPNPATDLINISSPGSIDEIRVIDLNGKTRIYISVFSNSTQLNTAELPPSVYIIEVKSREQVGRVRILKQ